MPSLRDYRDRIKSVKSTRKITSAMKMVAASKLRRAQEQAEASQPYAKSMAGMLARLAAGVVITSASPRLLAGTGADEKHLLIIVTADRGLCGGFNANIAKEARLKIAALKAEGKEVSLIFVGRKAYDVMKREHGSSVLHVFKDVFGKNKVDYARAQEISEFVNNKFEDGAFDVCSLIYNEFQSVMIQQPQINQLIPFELAESDGEEEESVSVTSPYDFEPGEEEILGKLLPRNLGVQIYSALLDSSAGEHAARMTAMDNATRNAGDMINDLTLIYNRARQASITKELIEIISGAEAV